MDITPTLLDVVGVEDRMPMAGRPEHAAVEEDLHGRVLATFDPEAIERDLVASLRNRAIVQEALVRNGTRWEHEPRFDVTYPYRPGRPMRG